MPEVRDILDEVFSLMQQQMRARLDSISATETEEYKKRAQRIDHLLSSLIGEGLHRRSKEMVSEKGATILGSRPSSFIGMGLH